MTDIAYRILVTASRTWSDRVGLYAELDRAELRAWNLGYRVIKVVHGGAKGGDKMAGAWARLRSPLPGMTRVAESYPLTDADWNPGGVFDPKAGHQRNDRMVAAGAHEAIGFTDLCKKPTCRRRKPHYSHGAAQCMASARAAGIPVQRITA